MTKFIPYILKTMWRHRTRTLLTAGGTAVALFVFCFVGSVQEGLNDLARHQQAGRAVIVFQANKFCPATSHLPQDYDRTIKKIPGVRDVMPIRVFTNNCRASLDVVVFYGVPAEKLKRARDFRVTAGSWEDFERHQDAAMIGQAVARRKELEPGDKFKMGQFMVTVAGVYASDDTAEENYIYTYLDFLQRGRDENMVGTVTQFEVLLDKEADPLTKSAAIDDAFRSAPVATITRPKGVFQAKSLGDLTELIQLSHYLGIACVGLVLALVATTTIMAVQDRVKEHAVLQTIGFSGPRIFGLVLTESLLTSAAGGAVGVGVAMLMLTWSTLAIGAEAVTISFTPSVQLAALGLLVSFVAGILAGVIPAWKAATADIVPALRDA